MNKLPAASTLIPASTAITPGIEAPTPSEPKTSFMPWFGTSGELPYWLDFFGVPLHPVEARSESAFILAWRVAVLAQERFRDLDKHDQLYLSDGIMSRYLAVLAANNLSDDNPKSRELLLLNAQTSEQYHQQYKQSVDADPKLVALLVRLGLR